MSEVLMKNEGALAWDDTEKGRFHKDYFDPMVIPTVEHELWALRNISIPHGLCKEVIKFIKNKIVMNHLAPLTSHAGFVCQRRMGSFGLFMICSH